MVSGSCGELGFTGGAQRSQRVRWEIGGCVGCRSAPVHYVSGVVPVHGSSRTKELLENSTQHLQRPLCVPQESQHISGLQRPYRADAPEESTPTHNYPRAEANRLVPDQP